MPGRFFDMAKSLLRGQVRVDEPLAGHTTWQVGGPADLFLAPADRTDLHSALRLLDEAKIPWVPLGAGSNLLVRDGGVRGAVIHLGNLQELSFDGDGSVHVGAGLPLMALIRAAARQGLAGLESLAGIPGTVGGAVAMNAGAGGQDLSQVVRTVTLAGSGGEETREAAALAFGYRRSALPDSLVITAATLNFKPGQPEALDEEIRRRLAHRRSAQAVGGPNAGSVFKNPPGRQAWQLIDEAGMRGAAVGGARVSAKHANFIVNDGSATAADILELMVRIQRAVRERSGVALEPEVRLVGED